MTCGRTVVRNGDEREMIWCDRIVVMLVRCVDGDESGDDLYIGGDCGGEVMVYREIVEEKWRL